MADEKEVKTKDGSLLFIKERDGMTLSGIKGHATLITVPTEVEGLPVRAVAKKAFLGNKDLTEVILPDSLDEIGDWAFAHCGSLKRITLPGRKISIGRGIFKDCKMLEQVRTGRREDIAWLLAATPILLDAEYLFVPEDAGSEEWLEKWDNRMKTLLFQEDEAGFTRLVLCGEEDLLASLPEYVAERRREKARMCFLRLMHPVGLNSENKSLLLEYLRGHTKGCESEAAWEVVLREHGDERDFYSLLKENGCVNAQNLPAMLDDMQEKHTEMKAFLMRYKESLGGNDFFASLSLDI